jgi:hypothetical protein
MFCRSTIGAIALAAALGMAVAGARAYDDALYPDLKGQWLRVGSGQGAPWDPTKPPGLAQQAPLTPEYQALYEANLAQQAGGQQGLDPTYQCVPGGMPRSMIAVLPMEVVVTPETTYMKFELFSVLRRIYTDGRDWPQTIEPSFVGYSIGHWEDQARTGRYDTLVVETRGLKGPRTFDSTGLPFHADNQTIIKERMSFDRTNPDTFRNEITTIDHALTRPWTVTRSYRRIAGKQAIWTEYVCTEDNHHVIIGKENYIVSGDGYLMPVRKDQSPPDLKYFDQPQK